MTRGCSLPVLLSSSESSSAESSTLSPFPAMGAVVNGAILDGAKLGGGIKSTSGPRGGLGVEEAPPSLGGGGRTSLFPGDRSSGNGGTI